MKRQLLTFFLALPLMAANGADLVLAAKDTPLAPIIVSKDAPPRTHDAAVTLAEYIAKISGVKPAVMDGEPQSVPERAIWVGYQPALKTLLKVFNYEVSEQQGLRDLFGFTLPLTERGESVGGTLALSPCHRFLVILTEDGTLYTYSIAAKQFIDGVKMKTPSGEAAATIGFRRPGENIITAPDGQQFFLTAPDGKDGTSVQFNRLVVGQTGLLTIEPYLRINCADGADWQDLRNCVRCFMPDLKRRDGSIDFVIGWDSKDREQAKPFIRVITDFIPPTGRKLEP